MASELNVFTRVHDDVQRLEQGIEVLVGGQLTPQLIGIDQLFSVLDDLKKELQGKRLELCLNTPQKNVQVTII